MHIMYMHMAMAVMRIAFNIVSYFYLSRPGIVKRTSPKNIHLSTRLNEAFFQIADDFPGDLLMKTCWILVLLCSSFPAFALGGGLQRAVVQAMRKSSCADGQSSGQHGAIAEIFGTSGGNECVEYVLFTERVRYVIRPRVAILLLLGDDVYIKLAGDQLLLRTSEARKDVHCAVLSMTLRGSEEEENEARDERSRPSVCLSNTGDEIPCAADREAFR
jgi:hypothetical protein